MAADQTELDKKKKECLRKCGSLLSGRDYTCRRLREKLAAAGYEEEVIEPVIQSLREARYLDDERYARSFVNAHWEDRSRLRIRMDLEKRGVPPEVISEVLRDEEEERGKDAEMRQIRKLIRKRGFDPASATYEEKNKVMAYLARKGYDMSLVRAAVNAELLDSDGFSV